MSTYAIVDTNFENSKYQINYAICPQCDEIIIELRTGIIQHNEDGYFIDVTKNGSKKIVYPQIGNIAHFEDIPAKYIEDYEEAIKVISLSPKASAALTRRLLQSILRNEYKVEAPSLSLEINKFIQIPGIPSHITDAVHAIRIIGNLAAHPTKDKSTGEIVSVEPNEAEWLIEVIEALFDFTFIQPKKLEKRKKELDEKLKGIGKKS